MMRSTGRSTPPRPASPMRTSSGNRCGSSGCSSREAGGLLLAGTDPTGAGGALPGFASIRQIQLLVEGGFSFEQAVRIGTLNGARYLGREREIGSIEAGKRADLILVDGDPVRDPAAL